MCVPWSRKWKCEMTNNLNGDQDYQKWNKQQKTEIREFRELKVGCRIVEKA